MSIATRTQDQHLQLQGDGFNHHGRPMAAGVWHLLQENQEIHAPNENSHVYIIKITWAPLSNQYINKSNNL